MTSLGEWRDAFDMRLNPNSYTFDLRIYPYAENKGRRSSWRMHGTSKRSWRRRRHLVVRQKVRAIDLHIETELTPRIDAS